MAKIRLDALLMQQGEFESREKARAVIMSGVVFFDGKRVDKPGLMVLEDAVLDVRGAVIPYVSRGGLKLEKALDVFAVPVAGRCCIDCGASTGGFTDCLLQRGAEKVYAVDVGYGQLDWRLRQDNRVVVLERTNVRYLTPADLGEAPSLAVIDVSFISLALILPPIYNLLTDSGEVVCLIKPQFEAGREHVGKKGVVRDPAIHMRVLEQFLSDAVTSGFGVMALDYSPIKGPEGNIEYLGYLRRDQSNGSNIDAEAVVKASYDML